MKITHLCLAGMISEGWSYQENMLIKYHIKLGHQVDVITSQWVYGFNNELQKTNKSEYVSEEGACYYRLGIINKDDIRYQFKRYKNVYETLEKSNPDILFIHNFQFLDIKTVALYAKNNPNIIIYIDNHADFSNSGKNWVSRVFLHKIIWRCCAKTIEPYTKMFYGVVPARVDFLKKIYNLPEEKCTLLVMGADDELVQRAEKPEVRIAIRKKYGFTEDDFVIVTGGKIDLYKKQTLLLMEAVLRIKNEEVKLLVFGSVVPELKEEMEKFIDGKKIIYIGWIQAEQSYEYFAAADLVVFPGRHSVFWEQVAGQGIPMLVKDWPGTHHVDLGGNVHFLKKDDAQEIEQEIERLVEYPEEYNKMKEIAMQGASFFSYKEIARRCIQGEDIAMRGKE